MASLMSSFNEMITCVVNFEISMHNSSHARRSISQLAKKTRVPAEDIIQSVRKLWLYFEGLSLFLFCSAVYDTFSISVFCLILVTSVPQPCPFLFFDRLGQVDLYQPDCRTIPSRSH